jgi:hypothetical protein
MGTSLKQEFLSAFDEDGDGIVTYDEFGKKGVTGFMLHYMGSGVTLSGSETFGYLRGSFAMGASMQKYSEASWNRGGDDVLKEYYTGASCMTAFRMSQMEIEAPDPFVPNLTWGKGKWPSYFLVSYLMKGMSLYGPGFPNAIGFPGLYGDAFQYADHTQNQGKCSGNVRSQPNPDALQRYFQEVQDGKRAPLDFTLYVPVGFGQVAGNNVPNVVETTEPGKILTASFAGDKESW